MTSTTPVALALGSNLGDRERYLGGALEDLASSITGLRVSAFHDTDPVGVHEQPRFLNAAATGRTSLSALDLLDRLLEVECRYGRTRPHPGAPRTLDLDLILYGAHIIEEPSIQIPHLRFRNRLFVLQPLAEIAADWVDPVTGHTVAELLRVLESRGSQG